MRFFGPFQRCCDPVQCGLGTGWISVTVTFPILSSARIEARLRR